MYLTPLRRVLVVLVLILGTQQPAFARIPESQLVALRQAKELIDSGQIELAEQSLNQIINSKKTHPRIRMVALQRLGVFKYRNGDIEAAMIAYRRVANLPFVNRTDLRVANKFTAQMSQRLEMHAQAVEHIDRYIADIQPGVDDLALQAQIYQKAGKNEEAVDIMQRALALADQQSAETKLEWWSTLVLAGQKTKDSDVVAYAFDNILKIEPSESFALSAIRSTLLRSDHRVLASDIAQYVELFPNEGVTPLQAAVAARDIEQVRTLGQDAALIEDSGVIPLSPLQLAAVLGYGDIVATLIELGTDIDSVTATGDTALDKAAKFNQPAIVEQLWQAGADMTRTPVLASLAESGQTDLIRQMLAAHPELLQRDNDDILLAAAFNGHADTINALVAMGARVHGETHRDATMLQAAVINGHVDAARALLEAGAPPNADGSVTANNPAIRIAAKDDHPEIIKLLIDAGADVDFVDADGMSLLHWAAENGSIAVAKNLLEAGVAIDAQTVEGMTPLMISTIEDHLDFTRYLVDSGANVNHRVNDQFTPLTLAARHASAPTLQLLLDEGGEFSDDAERDRALRWAVKDGSIDTVELLLQRGANTEGKAFSTDNPLSVAVNEQRTDIIRLLLANDAEIVKPASYLDEWTTREVTDFLKRNGFERTKKGRIEEWTLTSGGHTDTVTVKKHRSYYTIAGMMDIINQSGISVFYWIETKF